MNKVKIVPIPTQKHLDVGMDETSVNRASNLTDNRDKTECGVIEAQPLAEHADWEQSS